jgi:RNA polymerase sigma-70 factor (ECF subfamily)
MTIRLVLRSPQPALVDSRPPQGGRAALATRIRATDEQAFATLFLEHYESLCDFVNSYLQAPDIAEEVVQTVFLRVWESRASWHPKGSARAFLFAACRNRALDFLRHEQVAARSAETNAKLGLGRWSIPRMADADLEAAELGDRLRAVVAGLPERRRLVVVLRWQHQLSNPEIAQILGISVKGVEMQFSRALADLRQRLGQLAPDFV